MPKRVTLSNLAISESGFVFDPSSGATFTLNASGLTVLRAIREGRTVPETVAALHDEFDAVGADAADDVQDFVARLRQLGVVPSDFTMSARSEEVSA